MSDLAKRSGQIALAWADRAGPAIALTGIFVFFALIAPEGFVSGRNIETIFRHTVVVGIAALGMTAVMILGGIDLSVGSVAALGSVVVALVLGMESGGGPLVDQYPYLWPLISAGAGVVAGSLVGLANGLLVTGLRVVPFIVTLGTMGIVRGLAKALGSEQKVEAPASWINELNASVRGAEGPPWYLLPVGVWIMLAIAALIAGLLRYGRWGRYVFAIGSNEATARLCGVAVNRVKISTYTLMGATAGASGVMLFSFLTLGDPTASVGLELDVIAAVVIGGASLAGGQGSVFGALIGALIMSTIGAGCSFMGWPNWVQEIVTGVIIVVAVALDRLRHRTGG